MRRPGTDRLLLLAVVSFLAAFAVLPAGAWLVGAAATESVRADGAVLGAAGPAFANSLLQGGLSAALAVAIGYPAGVFLGRYRWPGRGAVRSALLLPFLLPTLVMVLGLLDLLGPSGVLGGPFPALRWLTVGVPGIVAVNLLYNIPIVVVLTAVGCEAASPALEETVASLGGGPARAYRESWAAPSLAGAACGGLLTFVLSALSFAPPILLCGDRCATVEVAVYRLALLDAEPAAAGILAIALIAAFAVPAIAYVLLGRRLRGRGPRGRAARPIPWRSPVAWGLAAVFVAVLAGELALVGAVLFRSVVPPGATRWGGPWRVLLGPTTASHLGLSALAAVGNTLLFAALAAAVGIVLATAAAFAVVRAPTRGTPVALLLFVPVLLSPVVLAEALTTFWGPLVGGTANVWILIVLSQALLGIPFALQSLEIPLAGLGPAGREAAASLGASPWGAFVDAELPRARSGWQTALLFVFALGLGEFTATYFLLTPLSRFTTLPVAVYDLTADRLPGAAGAASALLLLLSLAVFAAVVASGGAEE